MSFGEVLKEIRLYNGDTLRSLGEKINLSFTYIDKVEKNGTPINKGFLEKLLIVYPLQKNKLIKAYLEEVLPSNYTLDSKDTNNKTSIENFYFNFLKDLDVEERKNIYSSILEKIEFFSLKNGTYEKKKEDLKKAKEILKNIK